MNRACVYGMWPRMVILVYFLQHLVNDSELNSVMTPLVHYLFISEKEGYLLRIWQKPFPGFLLGGYLYKNAIILDGLCFISFEVLM